jgi:MinD-like ATPase involved in chromosome partitioning or flagellar assembly
MGADTLAADRSVEDDEFLEPTEPQGPADVRDTGQSPDFPAAEHPAAPVAHAPNAIDVTPAEPPDADAGRGAAIASAGSAATMTRSDVYGQPMRAGRPVNSGPVSAIGRWLQVKLSSELQRREWSVDEQLAQIAPMSRPNTIAVVSPKGGVGKTTVSFLLGNLLASELHLRVIALDANPDFGTLAALAGDEYRSNRSLADLLADAGRIESPAELHPYLSRLPTGLHILGAPVHAEVMAQVTPGLYARLLDFLERFYEVVILDLGSGVTYPLVQFAVQRADQSVVITTPDWVTSTGVLGALRYLQLEHGALVLNQASGSRNAANREVIEATFGRHSVAPRATIPFDQRLRAMLDTGTYELAGLPLATRVPVKELAASIATNFI